MKKGIALFLATFVFVFSIGTAKAHADVIPNTPQILDLIPGFEITEIYEAYSNLDSVQTAICDYLVGLYNTMYLGSRGFVFPSEDIQSLDSFTGKLRTIGAKIMGYTGIDGWRSRINQTFCIYLSSCIQYAMNQNYLTFNSWYNSLGSEFYLPYSTDAFNAWDNFYNDNTNDGIASFGREQTAWNSGSYYDFNWVGYVWSSSNDQSKYNQFIIDHSPVIYTNTAINTYISSVNPVQYVFDPLVQGRYIDSVFIQRSIVNSYQFFSYGFSDSMTGVLYNEPLSVRCYLNSSGKIVAENTGIRIRYGSNSYGSGTSIRNIVQYAFRITPFTVTASNVGSPQNFYGYYPLIQHVYLVDDLVNFGNPEEIFNVDELGIESDSQFRLSPNGRFIFPIKANLPELPEIQQWFIDNSKTDEGDDVDDNDFTQTVNNNTVINNYYPVSEDTPINIDVTWFTRCSDFVTYLWDNSVDFVNYCHDLLECLTFSDGENQSGPAFIIYGSLVFGVAGGIVSKLLL